MKEITELLKEGVVKFTYTKRDGTLRVAYGTLYSSAIKNLEFKSPLKKYVPATTGNLAYYDLEKKNWRCFTLSNLQAVICSAEITGDMEMQTLEDTYLDLLGISASEIEEILAAGAEPVEKKRCRRTKAKIEAERSAGAESTAEKEESLSVLDRLKRKYSKPTIHDDGFYVDDLVWESILSNVYNKTNTLMVGPAGTGKTELVRFVCDKMGIPYRHYNIGTMTDVQASLIGSHVIDSKGHSHFDVAQFVKDIQSPGVIMLDELNRNPQALNVLTNVLDGIRELNISGTGSGDARRIKVNENCMFFATANLGASYTGTAMIDEALETRFDFIGVDYMPIPQEVNLLIKRTGIGSEEASTICNIANNIRQLFSKEDLSKNISTRETLKVASKVAIGMSVKNAFRSIMERFEGTYADGEKSIVYKIIMSE